MSTGTTRATTTCPFDHTEAAGLAPGGSAEALDLPLDRPSPLQAPPQWDVLREACPVSRVELPSGQPSLMLTRYDDVKDLLGDPRFVRLQLRSARLDGDERASAMDDVMTGPGHQRWRRVLSRAFSVKRVMALQPRMVEIADDLIDRMLADGDRADLKAALGFPLPVYVICELLGVPVEDRDRFSGWSDRMLTLTRFSDEEIVASQAEFHEYMTGHIQAKREHPGEDLISELIGVVDAEDGRLSEAELLFSAQSLLVAGHETTANMIGKMVAMLLSRRERWEQLLADRSLVRSAVEESLRFDANLGLGLTRVITEPTQVAGVDIEPGTVVLNSMPAANRDPAAFDGADDMDLSRSPNPHLTFGAGPHSCLGQSLARVELQTTLSALLERVPTLELDVPETDLEALHGMLVGGLQTVPVRW